MAFLGLDHEENGAAGEESSIMVLSDALFDICNYNSSIERHCMPTITLICVFLSPNTE